MNRLDTGDNRLGCLSVISRCRVEAMGVSGVVGLEVGEVYKTLEDHRVHTYPRNPLFSVLLIKNGSKSLRVLVSQSPGILQEPQNVARLVHQRLPHGHL